MPVPFKNRAPQRVTPVVSPVRSPRVRTGVDVPDRRAPAAGSPGTTTEPGPAAVVRTRETAGNAAVVAALGGSPPRTAPGPTGLTGPMMLAGQDLVGNQAVAATAGGPSTAPQPTLVRQQQPAGKPEN